MFAIFNHLETLEHISSELVQQLEERKGVFMSMGSFLVGNTEESWRGSVTLGDIFIKITPFMRGFKQYFENYEHALATLKRLKEAVPPFAQFIHTTERDPRCNKLDLPSRLIEPIQRMPRY